MPDELTKITGICGRRYTGKTYLARHLLKPFNRIMVYDVRKEDKWDSYACVYDPAVLRTACSVNAFRIAYRPADVNAEMDYFCQMARWAGHTYGPTILLFDECHRFMSANNCPEVLMSLAAESRHDNLSIIFISQQLDTLSNKIFNEFSDIFVFQLINIDDIKFLQKYMMADASGIRNFQPRQYHHLVL